MAYRRKTATGKNLFWQFRDLPFERSVEFYFHFDLQGKSGLRLRMPGLGGTVLPQD